MMKLEAELDRQGIAITVGDLAKEAAMSHNISLNYGGATPSMCVFGVIPRPFYQDDGSGITAVVGALQTDVTPFREGDPHQADGSVDGPEGSGRGQDRESEPNSNSSAQAQRDGPRSHQGGLPSGDSRRCWLARTGRASEDQL